MDPKTFIFAGPSGSGKGTQIENLKEYLSRKSELEHLHISTGAEFRKFRKEKKETHTAKISQKIDDRGNLQPYFLAVWAWSEVLVNKFTGAEHILFDGSPRTEAEAKVLDSAFSFYDLDDINVVFIHADKGELKKRLLERGRADDTEEAIDNRLDWYESKVRPALETYRGDKRYKLHDIDGNQDEEGVFNDIISSVF